ncbi:MAG TPA: DinB family protein [Gemmatimonadaceae bacterium]|nr:DinB family protein [Gemmatimonadaceae bacterium]
MDDHTRILEQLRRTYDGDAWYGPSLRALLADVDAATAATRPIPTAHTIWELVRHISVWLMAARRRLAGEQVEYTDDADWPVMPDPTDIAWLATLDVLEQAQRSLEHLVAGMPAAALHELVPGKRYTAAVMLHGVVQHAVYHAGQIALVKKAARTAGASR